MPRRKAARPATIHAYTLHRKTAEFEGVRTRERRLPLRCLPAYHMEEARLWELAAVSLERAGLEEPAKKVRQLVEGERGRARRIAQRIERERTRKTA